MHRLRRHNESCPRRLLVFLLLASLFAGTTAAWGLAPGDSVKINEVYYDPGALPQESNEFIELFNAGSTTVYLDGAVITDEGNAGGNEATFRFPGLPGQTAIPLAPGERLLLVPDAIGCPYPDVDFEFYAGGSDTDDLGVPNLVKTSGLALELILGNGGDGVTLSTGVSTGNIIPCNEIVDGVSWESGGSGDVTALSDSICTDATPGSEASGSFGLSRCPDGYDTDSGSDFVVLLQTPRAANDCPAAPVFLQQSYAPCVPADAEAVTVRSWWWDLNGNIQEVWLFSRDAQEATFDSLLMNSIGDSLYEQTLPGQADQTLVEYFFVAIDSTAFSTRWPESGSLSYRVGIVPIPDVQAPAAPDSCGTSPLVGQAVNVLGVVTHEKREFSDTYFYLQQDNVANGAVRIHVADGSFRPELGDSVLVSGVVSEYMCQTQVDAFDGCLSVVGTGGMVTPRVLGAIEDVELEENESVLVTVPGPLTAQSGVVADITSEGIVLQWQVGSAQDPVWVGTDTFEPDSIGPTPEPMPGLILDALTGIVALRESYLTMDPATRLRLEPRRDNDVDVNYTDVAGTTRPPYRLLPNRPNPFNPNTMLAFDLDREAPVWLTVFNVGGERVRRLARGQVLAAGRHQLPWDGRDDRGRVLPSGVYLIKLEAAGRVASRKLHLLR